MSRYHYFTFRITEKNYKLIAEDETSNDKKKWETVKATLEELGTYEPKQATINFHDGEQKSIRSRAFTAVLNFDKAKLDEADRVKLLKAKALIYVGEGESFYRDNPNLDDDIKSFLPKNPEEVTLAEVQKAKAVLSEFNTIIGSIDYRDQTIEFKQPRPRT